MARKQKDPISPYSLRQAAAKFNRQSDRGSALIAVAWVDDALEECLRVYFQQDKTIANLILQPDGPLGSFSSRIKIAYLLGITTASLYADLEIMRRIRNDFAHVRQEVRFNDQSIKDRCKSLIGANAFERGTGQTIRSPRQMFLISAFLAADYLLAYVKNPKPPKTPVFDLYGTVIHRAAKSMSLRELKAAMENLDNLHAHRRKSTSRSRKTL